MQWKPSRIPQSSAFAPDEGRGKAAALKSHALRLHGLHPAKQKLQLVQGRVKLVGLVMLGALANLVNER